MIWILAIITTISVSASPDVTIKKVGVFTDEAKCETTRSALQESAEPGHMYICVKHEKKDQ